MTFLEQIAKITRSLNEADVQVPDDMGASAAPEAAPEPEADEPQTFSPQSEVMLVRLLKQALIMDVKPDDIITINKIGDINENNAKDALTKIVTLMKVYSPDVGVEVETSE